MPDRRIHSVGRRLDTRNRYTVDRFRHSTAQVDRVRASLLLRPDPS
jgi:hypothetical protein